MDTRVAGIFALALLFVSQSWALGQTDASFDTAPLIKTAQEHIFRTPNESAFVLREQPIMVWSNPATFDQKGIVLVWLNKDRPQVVATFFHSTHPDGVRTMFEGHSLSQGPIEGSLRENRFWDVQKPGVIFKALTEPVPAPVAARRHCKCANWLESSTSC